MTEDNIIALIFTIGGGLFLFAVWTIFFRKEPRTPSIPVPPMPQRVEPPANARIYSTQRNAPSPRVPQRRVAVPYQVPHINENAFGSSGMPNLRTPLQDRVRHHEDIHEQDDQEESP